MLYLTPISNDQHIQCNAGVFLSLSMSCQYEQKIKVAFLRNAELKMLNCIKPRMAQLLLHEGEHKLTEEAIHVMHHKNAKSEKC